MEEIQADCRIVREDRASDGVRKLLLGLADGENVETVLIPNLRRTTLCVSSQVGCAVACTFCATGTLGIRRDLEAAEIVAQYTAARDLLERDPGGEPPIENLVFMGMGEPFLNFDRVNSALRTLIDEHGFHSRIITLSTIGIPDRIVPFGRFFPHVRLAVSLHAPDDERRAQLVPIARRFALQELLEACRDYQRELGKRIFFEYVLIRGFNDSEDDARRLAELLSGFDATVNLIPLHPGGPLDAAAPTSEEADRFWVALKRGFHGHVTFRRSRGLDIAAACGQLAARR